MRDGQKVQQRYSYKYNNITRAISESYLPTATTRTAYGTCNTTHNTLGKLAYPTHRHSHYIGKAGEGCGVLGCEIQQIADGGGLAEHHVASIMHPQIRVRTRCVDGGGGTARGFPVANARHRLQMTHQEESRRYVAKARHRQCVRSRERDVRRVILCTFAS